jgi:hypothetical protein
MFIYAYVHVARPFREVEPELLASTPLLSGWADVAYREGERLYARIGSKGGRMAKSVELRLGAPSRGGVETWIPIEWHATGPSALFPRLEGDIVVAALGDEQTQVALRGRYIVPLGVVGRALDRTLLHRVAEASIKTFVDRIGASLSTGPPASTEIVP